MNAAETLELLKNEVPKFHQFKGQPHSWAIREDVLQWLADNVKSGQRTLETGAGYSSVMFMAAGAHHTAISPAQTEHERIKEWCVEHNIPVEHSQFYAECSQDILPSLPADPLDIVLVDGAHSFPFPFIDWYWTATRLNKGGLMLLDDTHIRTVHVLKEFLLAEVDRWSLVDQVGKTSVFRKDSEEVFAQGVDWPAQPYNKDLLDDNVVELNWKDHLKSVPVVGPFLEGVYKVFK